MSGETRPTPQPRTTEDLQLRETASPPRYAKATDRPVQYVAAADRQGNVIGYVWANDEDDAAGWKVRPAGGDAAFNLGVMWVSRLHEAKLRGIAPTAALAEMVRDSDPAKASHIVPGSLRQAPSLQAVQELAAQD
ncbi:hypothetical protein [Streptomyces sp. NPDC060031]|uniref:hypothetical protein n=1 Tax=Streptomyces sp. NPDC060031 TaxID=3347043 RepID=UPI003673A555